VRPQPPTATRGVCALWPLVSSQSLACGENTERNAAAEEKRTETASWMESHTMVGYNFIAIGFGFELGVWLPWLLPKLRPMRILAFVWPLHSGGIRDFSSDFEL